jgi:hypothetical protein
LPVEITIFEDLFLPRAIAILATNFDPRTCIQKILSASSDGRERQSYRKVGSQSHRSKEKIYDSGVAARFGLLFESAQAYGGFRQGIALSPFFKLLDLPLFDRGNTRVLFCY